MHMQWSIFGHLQVSRPENETPISYFQAVRIKLPHLSSRQPQISASQGVFKTLKFNSRAKKKLVNLHCTGYPKSNEQKTLKSVKFSLFLLFFPSILYIFINFLIFPLTVCSSDQTTLYWLFQVYVLLKRLIIKIKQELIVSNLINCFVMLQVRKLEFVLADALDKKCDTVITCGGLSSNHCRTTAVATKQIGLNCCLLLRSSDQVLQQ